MQWILGLLSRMLPILSEVLEEMPVILHHRCERAPKSMWMVRCNWHYWEYTNLNIKNGGRVRLEEKVSFFFFLPSLPSPTFFFPLHHLIPSNHLSQFSSECLAFYFDRSFRTRYGNGKLQYSWLSSLYLVMDYSKMKTWTATKFCLHQISNRVGCKKFSQN